MSWRTEILRAISGQNANFGGVVLRMLLAALTPIYWLFTAVRNWLYHARWLAIARVDLLVISVGNLTVGGTGKTPLIAWLGRWFQKRGRHPAIVSRGYGARTSANDEARELARQLPAVPHFQNANRVAAAQTALRDAAIDVLLLDDAFQHRRLARDLDIVLLDALEPFGYEWLLPRGLLREPLASLRRADVIGLTRADAVDESRRQQIRKRVRDHAPQAIWIEMAHRPTRLINAQGEERSFQDVRGQTCGAFCGIGNPRGFWHTLEELGVDCRFQLEFADHCDYANDDRRRLVAHLQSAVANGGPLDFLLCTAKDLVKFSEVKIENVPLWAVQIELELLVGNEQFEALLEKLAATNRRRIPTTD